MYINGLFIKVRMYMHQDICACLQYLMVGFV